jgi:hypothetical protein
VKSLFHSASSTPGGVGLACGYLYLNPGSLFDIVVGEFEDPGATCAPAAASKVPLVAERVLSISAV